MSRKLILRCLILLLIHVNHSLEFPSNLTKVKAEKTRETIRTMRIEAIHDDYEEFYDMKTEENNEKPIPNSEETAIIVVPSMLYNYTLHSYIPLFRIFDLFGTNFVSAIHL